jgi:hypothetical protein
MKLNEFDMTREEKDALVKRLEEEEAAAALTYPTCLVCNAGQRNVKEMIWCDTCPKQICLGHANKITLDGWDVSTHWIRCPQCVRAKITRITPSC